MDLRYCHMHLELPENPRLSYFIITFYIFCTHFLKNSAESKKYKAVIIRIDSPGGDALGSDL